MLNFRFNTHSYFPESGSGKRFQASRMRAIDSPHEITPRNIILREKFENFSIFASIHTSISLNQGQGSIFTLRECAQSIFRMILGLYRLFWQKKFFEKNFRKNLHKSRFFLAHPVVLKGGPTYGRIEKF